MIVLLTCLGARNAINRTALKQTRKNPVTVQVVKLLQMNLDIRQGNAEEACFVLSF